MRDDGACLKPNQAPEKDEQRKWRKRRRRREEEMMRLIRRWVQERMDEKTLKKLR